MNPGKLVCASILVTLGLFAPGCAVDTGDAAVSIDEENVAESAAALSVDHVSPVDNVEVWDSGNTNSLSAWMSINCATTYRGGNDNYMLTDLTAFQEPTTNFDNFIGKMDGSCTDHTTSGNETGTVETDNIFTGSWRAGGSTVSSATNHVPIGVKLRVYGGIGPSYVKDIAIGHTLPTFGAATTWSSFALGYSGDEVTATCDPGKVMTGLRLKYNTDNGKIQHVQIFCRAYS
ncbi:MAG: hypothetical protein QM820_54365 [Minicystis sp.]